MKIEPTVSVVIPVYNRAHLLEPVLQSVFQQTRPPEEVIVVDDASTDDPETVTCQFPFVKLIRNPHNRGAAGARNVGAAQASGNILAFLDSDDHWLPDKLENQLAVFQNSELDNLALVYGAYIRHDRRGGEKGRIIPARYRGNLTRILLRRGNVVSNFSNFIVKRDAWEALGGLDLRFPPKEDLEFFLRLSIKGYTCDITPKTVFEKFEGDKEQITRNPSLKIRGTLRFYNAYKDRIYATPNTNFITNLNHLIQILIRTGKKQKAKRIRRILFAYFPPWKHPLQLRFYLSAFFTPHT